MDYVALGLTDYLKVVRQPMDLGTLEQRCVDGWYDEDCDDSYERTGCDREEESLQLAVRASRFAADVRRCFANALAYNCDQSAIADAAQAAASRDCRFLGFTVRVLESG